METKDSVLETLISNQNIILTFINDELKASHYTEALIVGIIVAIGGAFAAYIFSVIQKKQDEVRSNLRSIVVSLHGMISELEDLSLNYWLSDASNDELEDNKNSIKIKNTLKLIRKYKDQYRRTNPDQEYFTNIERFCSAVFDIATGEDFESPYRKKSRQKAAVISRECTEAKATLNEIIISL